jgi:GNAT superfamily N-acetyltransferase
LVAAAGGGYAPAMPPHSDILALFDRDMRANPPPPGPGYRQERLAGASFTVGPSPEPHQNTVEYTALDERAAEGCIDAVVARFTELKHALEWKVHAHDRPADLGARLLAKGFEQGGRETLMVRPVGTDDAPASPAGIDIRHVTDPALLADLVAVETEVWNDDNGWLADALAAELAQDAQALAIYIAYAGATPVSTGWIRFHGGRAFATLWGGSTLKAYRSRGIYRALVGIRAALARSRGAAFLAVEASDESRPILERNGFRALTVIDSYFWQPVET